jgi:hypothetical protein
MIRKQWRGFEGGSVEALHMMNVWMPSRAGASGKRLHAICTRYAQTRLGAGNTIWRLQRTTWIPTYSVLFTSS